jgi:hypothetical protein
MEVSGCSKFLPCTHWTADWVAPILQDHNIQYNIYCHESSSPITNITFKFEHTIYLHTQIHRSFYFLKYNTRGLLKKGTG